MTAHLNRRSFHKRLAKHAAAGAALIGCAPTIITAQKTEAPVTVGDGEFTYLVEHHCVTLPDQYHWQVTHNVAVDQAGNLYVIHEGAAQLEDHPAIFVFDAAGKFIRAFGQQFQGGGHGLEVRQEGSEEFLYVTAYQQVKMFAKLTLDGEVVWERRAPMESERYANGEDTNPTGAWGRNRFMPTNTAFFDNGEFLVADGYGAWCVHYYDAEANWKSVFGQVGKKDGDFSLPHGIWVDDRGGDAKIVVADRANNRLQWFTTKGEHLHTQGDYLLPANIDTHGDLMLVPELQARITILDKDNQVVARLGDDANWRAQVLAEEFKMRREPDRWQDGKFLHPHDACFDADGNIFVAEWVATGRITKLTRVS